MQLMGFLQRQFEKFPLGVPKIAVLMKSDLRGMESGLFDTNGLLKYGITEICECSARIGQVNEF